MALVERKINLTFKLGEGSFGDSGFDTVVVSGLRVSAKISKAGGPQPAHVSLDVFGLTPSIMKQLSTLGLIARQTRRNVVQIDAGDDEAGIATVFIGTIINGYGDYQASPDVVFHVEAGTGILEALIPNDAISVKGGSDAVTILNGLARKMNLVLESNGVQKQLDNGYWPGSLRDQVQAICDHAGINWFIDQGVLAIWDPDSSRGGVIPLVKKDSGMMGYPAFTSNGIIFKTLFNPNIAFGRNVKVESSRPELSGANGTWNVVGLDYNLDANLPGGDWSMLVQGVPKGFGPGIPTPSG